MEVARVVEGQFRSLRDRDFAVAAEADRRVDRHIMLRELLPNAMAPIVVAATLNVARAILLESYVSFLGYGIQPPTPSWGNMLENAQEYLASAPWLAIVPGIAITLAVTSFNFVGDGLRDALDTRLDHRMTDAAASSRGPARHFHDTAKRRFLLSTASPSPCGRARRWRWSANPAPAKASPAFPSCASRRAAPAAASRAGTCFLRRPA